MFDLFLEQELSDHDPPFGILIDSLIVDAFLDLLEFPLIPFEIMQSFLGLATLIFLQSLPHTDRALHPLNDLAEHVDLNYSNYD